MVLQRDKPAAVWGWAAPGEKVTVSFAGQTADATIAELKDQYAKGKADWESQKAKEAERAKADGAK